MPLKQAVPRLRGALYLDERPRAHSRRRMQRLYLPPQTIRRQSRPRWPYLVLALYVVLIGMLAVLLVTLLVARTEVPA
jgi:CHASE1-domain containing sensor protein